MTDIVPESAENFRFVGYSDLKPEKSRSYTVGAVLSPTRNIDLTADYYDIKKTDVIVLAPYMGQAFVAYYTRQPLPPGYTLLSVGDPDPDYTNALPRATLISAPYANAASERSAGYDFSATGRFNITDDIRFTTSANGTYVPLGVGAEFAVADSMTLAASAEYDWDIAGPGASPIVGKVGVNWHF